jgi:hypothetical protein
MASPGAAEGAGGAASAGARGGGVSRDASALPRNRAAARIEGGAARGPVGGSSAGVGGACVDGGDSSSAFTSGVALALSDSASARGEEVCGTRSRPVLAGAALTNA